LRKKHGKKHGHPKSQQNHRTDGMRGQMGADGEVDGEGRWGHPLIKSLKYKTIQ
jgi:hypothetical protein